MVDSYAESARKAAGGNWRKPRMKTYDYNEEFGTNYYQPMMKYIHEREGEGPFFTRYDVHMPEKAEVVGNKYSNMRHDDVRSTELELSDFLARSYKKQINELNSSTATTHRLIAHNSKDDTHYTRAQLLGCHLECDNDRKHYCKELYLMNLKDMARREERARLEAQMELEAARRKKWADEYLQYGPEGKPPQLDEETIERIRDVRAKYHWIFRPRTIEEVKQWLASK